MKRLIFVSFAFLAVLFYELSGGADFQPRRATAPNAPQTTEPVAVTAAKSEPVNATVLVASPAIKVVDPVPEPVSDTPELARVAENAGPDIDSLAQLDQIRTSLNQGLSLFPESNPDTQTLVLASLEQGVAGLTTQVPEAEAPTSETVAVAAPKADIREITGSRVNMRDGPGTTYPVITKLTVGHEVEVLGDSGNGWLRLRTLPGKQIGWISASLVSKTKR